MEKKLKPVHIIRGITENKEFAKAFNNFFNDNKENNKEIIKDFFIEQACKYAEAYVDLKRKYDKYIELSITLLDENREQYYRIKELELGNKS